MQDLNQILPPVEEETGSDKLSVHTKKGIWKRFIRMLLKCRLPWIWLTAYIILDFSTINFGLSETDYTAQLFSGDTSPELLAKLIGILVLNLLLSDAVVFVRMVTEAKINRNMRELLLEKIMKLPMKWFKDENPREAVYRILRNAQAVDSTIILFVLPIAAALYKSVSIFGRIFSYDWRLSIILVAFIPVQLLMGFLFGRINYSLNEKESGLKAELMRRLAELAANIPVAKAFAKENKETENGSELTERLYRLDIKGSWISQFMDLSETASSLVQSLIMVTVGYFLLKNSEITTRAWVTFFMFSSLFTNAVFELLMYWNNVKLIQGGAERIADIMDAEEEDRSGKECPRLEGDIAVSHLSFSYDKDKPVLKDVSCTFKDGCVTALLGVSGCGKTTLSSLLMRLYEPDHGEISVGGTNVKEFALPAYRRHFVAVSQNPMLFSGTIRENVCYGNKGVDDAALKAALEKAGAMEFVSSLPDGLETMLEEYGDNLSGGQKQRIALARALLSDAHYIILDEPAASMDAIAVGELTKILKDSAENRCMIIIAHDKPILSACDRIIVIEEGKVSCEGTRDEVFANSSFVREMRGGA